MIDFVKPESATVEYVGKDTWHIHNSGKTYQLCAHPTIVGKLHIEHLDSETPLKFTESTATFFGRTVLQRGPDRYCAGPVTFGNVGIGTIQIEDTDWLPIADALCEGNWKQATERERGITRKNIAARDYYSMLRHKNSILPSTPESIERALKHFIAAGGTRDQISVVEHAAADEGSMRNWSDIDGLISVFEPE